MGKDHAPSAYRKILKESKSGNVNIQTLIKEARQLSDSYYSSLALFGLSMDRCLDNKQASQLRNDALKLVEKENRPWRRAELITLISKAGKGMPVSNDIIKLIEQISEPKARSEAIIGSVKNLGCENTSQLLEIAVKIEGHEMDSCKPVIKFWVAECPNFELIMNILEKVKDSQNKIRLLGYLQLQLTRARIQTTEPIEMAVEQTMKLAEKLELLKYLASQSDDIESLEVIAAAITGLETPIEEASLLTTLAGSADRARQKQLALDWFNSALECLEEIDNLQETASIRFNLAQGFQRLGHEEIAGQNFKLALEGARENEKLRTRIEKSMGMKPEKEFKPVISKSSRHVLALHDTYEGSFSTAHIRIIATAAPLCIAYGLDLALVDFPTKDLASMVQKVSADTNIGKGGRYLKELANENRIVLTTSDELNSVGLPVATTSRPEMGKSITLEDASKKAKSHPAKRLCVIMGLGKKGLPKSLLANVDYHAEITGSNVPLETSTAMGIIAQMMGKL